MIQTFHLPLPPSLNNSFLNLRGRGRIKSTKYRAWIEEAGYRLNGQSPRRVEGPVRVSIVAVRENRLRDIDNIIKPILDLLVRHGVIEDDRRVEVVAAAWGSSDNLKGVSVEVTPHSPEASVLSSSNTPRRIQPGQPR